jgi:hypothetical protein
MITWLFDTRTQAIAEEDWERIKDAIAERFAKKWPNLREVPRLNTLALRVGRDR